MLVSEFKLILFLLLSKSHLFISTKVSFAIKSVNSHPKKRLFCNIEAAEKLNRLTFFSYCTYKVKINCFTPQYETMPTCLCFYAFKAMLHGSSTTEDAFIREM